MRISDWSSDVCSSDLDTADDERLRYLPGDRQGYATDRRSPHTVRADAEGDLTETVLPGVELIAELPAALLDLERSEERRVGKECVCTCRSRWWPYHYKKKNQFITMIAIT